MRTDPSPGGQPSLADFFYHCDDLFSVTALTDEDGDPVEFYDYDVYGTPFVFDANGNQLSSGSAFANPYMFTGRRFDLESRFYYYRTRYYEPAIGRFTTRDTIGIWRDAGNFGSGVAYVGSAPWVWVDPLGTAKVPPLGSRWSDYLKCQIQPGECLTCGDPARVTQCHKCIDDKATRYKTKLPGSQAVSTGVGVLGTVAVGAGGVLIIGSGPTWMGHRLGGGWRRHRVVGILRRSRNGRPDV